MFLKASRTQNSIGEIVYDDFSGGLNLRDSPSLIAKNQSPEAQNVRVRGGPVGKRHGYRKLYPDSLGAGEIHGVFSFKNASGVKHRIILHSTKLYSQALNYNPVPIRSGLADAKATSFILSDTLYILNGTDFFQSDGSDVVGYIPTVLVGRSPSGAPNAGTVYESFNLKSSGFKISFTADGTSITYTLPYTSLDADLLSIEYNGVTYAELVAFTVDRTTGTITTPLTALGDATTQFDITNPSGTTFRYTFDGTGTAPTLTSLVVGQYVYINAQNFAAANKGWFAVTAKDSTYFEITNASGVAENDKTIGTGSLNKVDVTGVPLGIPALGNANNVVITAHKSSLVNPEFINNCTIAEVYGGKTDATVFASGNPNFPDQVWHTRLYGSNYSADYWPTDAVQKIPGNVTGLKHLYDLLYVIHSGGHGSLSYVDGPSGYPIFPYTAINSEKGSDIPNSAQEVNNSIVCASTDYGVLQILSNTTVNNRLSVIDISDLINKGGSERTDLGLLRETNLADAVSYNFDGYYGLCINDVCYVWDYKLNAWLYDTNIPASCFAVIDNTLCFGSNTEGMVYQFDPTLQSDDGVAIDSWIKTKVDDGGNPSWVKVINELTLIAKPLNRASVDVLFLSRQSNGELTLQMQIYAFSFINFGFVNFTFNTSFFPVVKRKIMSKRANYFQFQLRNNVLDEGMSVVSLKAEFDQGSEMR